MADDTPNIYTPAPWTHDADDPNLVCALKEHGERSVPVFVNVAETFGTTFGTNRTAGPTAEDNARRIVACVNFCEGVPTADLENSLEREHTLADEDEAIVAKLNEMGEERNDLRNENGRLKERVAELEKACETVLKWVAHDFTSLRKPPEGTPDAGEAERILRDALSGENASREAEVNQ
jgi:hypothetical protein